MRQPSVAGLPHSVHARLKNLAKEAGRPFAELLELYAVERFLHRLGRSPARERFIHTYSAYERGIDTLWGMYQWLDRAPRGRNEQRRQPWFRRHDEYDER